MRNARVSGAVVAGARNVDRESRSTRAARATIDRRARVPMRVDLRVPARVFEAKDRA